ncbi:MAG: hypothetical protein GX567_10655 [Clostridia bacterium]|nr:hypothetical protein [Clostridia bacterium]
MIYQLSIHDNGVQGAGNGYSNSIVTLTVFLSAETKGRIYFFGACIRGTPIYKVIDDITNENIDNMIWGKQGNYFDR